MTVLLEVRNLRKEFKETVAVKDVSFSVAQGRCFGLLGPNGAGKTTTIEVIEDILPPTSGKVFYRGAPRTSLFREEIGIQFQHTSLLNFLSVEETLCTFQKLFSNTEDLEALINLCDLSLIRARANNKLSGGQKQRLMLALALINRPKLVFLDEPSTGLDPQSRRNLWAIVEKIKGEGKTVIMTTHSMEEAQHLCDDIAIMDQGIIIAQGSPQELINTHCRTATLSLPLDNLRQYAEIAHLNWVERDGRAVIHTDDIDLLLHTLNSSQIGLNGMNIHTPTLEDVFLQLTGRTLRE